MPSSRQSQLAVVQFGPLLTNLARKIALIDHALAELSRSAIRAGSGDVGGVALVVFPEYALTGYPNAEQPQAALVTDPMIALYIRLVELARYYALHVGYAEQADDQMFSTALLVGMAGIVARYRKIYIVGDDTLLHPVHHSIRPPNLRRLADDKFGTHAYTKKKSHAPGK